MPRGRPKGSPNKATALVEKHLAGKYGVLPREFLLGVMLDEGLELPIRVDAAKAAAPYVHPRLSQIDANHSGSIDVRAFLLKLGEPED
jgi:hypothetical protein